MSHDIAVVENTLSKKENHWVRNLFEGLDNEPQAWFHTGMFHQASGYCVCGHSIVDQFEIQHRKTGVKKFVGSSCIHHFFEVNAETYNSLMNSVEALKQQVVEMKRMKAEAEQDLLIEQLGELYKSKCKEVNEMRERYRKMGTRLPNELYNVSAYAKNMSFKRKSAYIKWYNKQIAILDNGLAVGNPDGWDEYAKLKDYTVQAVINHIQNNEVVSGRVTDAYSYQSYYNQNPIVVVDKTTCLVVDQRNNKIYRVGSYNDAKTQRDKIQTI